MTVRDTLEGIQARTGNYTKPIPKPKRKLPSAEGVPPPLPQRRAANPEREEKDNSFRAGQCKRETRRNESTEEFIQPFPGIRNHSREEIQSKVATGIAEPYRKNRNRVKPPEQEENRIRQ